MKKFLLTCIAVLGLGVFASAETVTYTYSEKGFDNGAELTTTTVDGVTVSYGKGTNSNSPKYYESGNAGRLYGSNTITFSVAEGSKIDKIEFTVGSSNKFNAASTANVGEFDAANAVWTGADQTVTITQGGTSGHVRIVSWTLTYTPGEAPAVAAPQISCADNKVTITAEGADAIHYTIDGTEPTTASTKYTASFDITASVTVKAIAVKGADVSRVTTFNAEYIGTYKNYAELAVLGKGAKGTVEGPITGIYKNGRNLYTVDAAGNFMLLFDYNKFAGVTDFANGDQFASVSGENSDNYGVPELINVTLGAKTAGTAVQPEVLTVEELSMEMLNKYVKIENVKIVAGNKANNYDMTDATGTLALYNQFNNANNYDVLEVPEGEGFTVTGFVGCYNTTLQVVPVLIEGGRTMEPVATPTFTVEAGPVAAGTTVEIHTATADATIFYTLDGTEPGASSTQYTGAITIDKAMTIKAIAIKEGMLDSDVAVAEYTILEAGASAVTFDFTDPASLTPAVAAPEEGQGTTLHETYVENDRVKITFSDKAGATTDLRLYNSKGNIDLRLYTNQYFTVSAAEGYHLGDIEFTSAATGKLPLTCDEVGTFAADGMKGTWTAPIDENTVGEVTFKATATSRISTITVTYKEGSPSGVDNIAVEAENAPAEYYNLQGVRVDNPTPGLYIVRRGNTTTKELVR